MPQKILVLEKVEENKEKLHVIPVCLINEVATGDDRMKKFL